MLLVFNDQHRTHLGLDFVAYHPRLKTMRRWTYEPVKSEQHSVRIILRRENVLNFNSGQKMKKKEAAINSTSP